MPVANRPGEGSRPSLREEKKNQHRSAIRIYSIIGDILVWDWPCHGVFLFHARRTEYISYILGRESSVLGVLIPCALQSCLSHTYTKQDLIMSLGSPYANFSSTWPTLKNQPLSALHTVPAHPESEATILPLRYRIGIFLRPQSVQSTVQYMCMYVHAVLRTSYPVPRHLSSYLLPSVQMKQARTISTPKEKENSAS